MMKKIMIGLLVMIVLSACAGGSSASVEGQWKLVSYNQTAAMPDVEASIEFKDGQMSGNVGCNGFGGEYTVSGDTLEFGPVMSTMMFCEAVADQESTVLATLQEKTSFVIDGNMMTIISADGSSSIVLEKK